MTEIVNHCPHCGKNFYSAFSQHLPPGMELISYENKEQCPSCKSLIPVPDVRSINIDGNTRLLPFGASATFSDRKNIQNIINEVYFTIWKNGINSFTWKVWKYKRDIYIACREIYEWKISLHESGEDHIGFTSNYIKNKNIKIQKNRDRLFFTADRGTPFAAHAYRIARVIIRSRSDFEREFQYKPGRKLNKINKIYPMSCRETGFDFIYTEGHPAKFKETEYLDYNSIAILSMSKNHFLSVLPISEVNDIIMSENNSIFTHSFNYNDTEKSLFKFGLSDKNVFLLEIDHE
ncbi:MAG: hypothetical protein R3E11_02775 [Sphingobium sp.]|nr:hypothetical protein [Sphingobium sp.]MCP5398416.1 hypothetical protein [Sphingomonas sp.]